MVYKGATKTKMRFCSQEKLEVMVLIFSDGVFRYGATKGKMGS